MIRPLTTADIDAFMAHAEKQAAENGRGKTVRFALRQPGAPRDRPRFRSTIEDGLRKPVGEPGWIRIWIAVEPQEQEIAGHVGLRAPAEPRSAHRAFVDVGVLEPYRRRGLAARLYEEAIAWASGQEQLAWLDAEVFAHNAPALTLHQRLGFVETARVADLFRLDGLPVDDVRLSLRLPRRSG
jgi:RimJ/RimL family protein N-acetyltransferase